MVTAWATVWASGPSRAAEKSMASRTTVEWAVRKIVVAISSAAEAKALPTIWRVTTSVCSTIAHDSLLAGQVEGSRAVPPGHPAGRHDDRGVVLVDEERPRHPGRTHLVPPPQDRSVQVPVRQREESKAGAVGLAGFRTSVDTPFPLRQTLGPGKRSESGQSDRPHLDRIVGILADTVKLLVAILEGLDEFHQPGRGHPGVGNGHLDVETLALVAHVSGPHPLGHAAGDARREFRLQLVE